MITFYMELVSRLHQGHAMTHIKITDVVIRWQFSDSLGVLTGKVGFTVSYFNVNSLRVTERVMIFNLIEINAIWLHGTNNVARNTFLTLSKRL